MSKHKQTKADLIRSLLKTGKGPREIAQACDESGWGETCKNHLPQIYRLMKEPPASTPARAEDGLPLTLVFRISEADAARLDTLSAMLPTMGRAGIAREAFRRGLDAFDKALAESDETSRLAALARVLGLAPSPQR